MKHKVKTAELRKLLLICGVISSLQLTWKILKNKSPAS